MSGWTQELAPNKHIDNVAVQTQLEERRPKSPVAPWGGAPQEEGQRGAASQRQDLEQGPITWLLGGVFSAMQEIPESLQDLGKAESATWQEHVILVGGCCCNTLSPT